jgi:murein DD-endopeptidase MepM/ murein hydrolase activator NlpD
MKYKQPVAGSITSFFSHSNTDPFADGTYNYFCTNRYRAGHKGTDFGAGNGTSIKAGATGIIEVVKNNCEPHDNTCPNQMGDQCNGGFGNYVRVRHSNNARTYYAHMKSTSVTANQTVYTYTTLGLVGSSGNSSGCHLHFEIRYPDINASSAVDPFYGPCNWITQSLWNGPQPIGMDE